jgi:hypothetical protein
MAVVGWVLNPPQFLFFHFYLSMPQLHISDEYFNRSAATVADTPLYKTRVAYAVFARENGMVCGANRAVGFINRQCLSPVTIRARRDGDTFAANEAVMIIEGLFGELVNLETTYLGMLAFSGAATHMAKITRSAGPIPVIDMAARHYPSLRLRPWRHHRIRLQRPPGTRRCRRTKRQNHCHQRLYSGQSRRLHRLPRPHGRHRHRQLGQFHDLHQRYYPRL